MVSIRKKRHLVSTEGGPMTVGGGERSRPKSLALEKQSSLKDSQAAVPSNAKEVASGEKSNTRKRGRKKKIQEANKERQTLQDGTSNAGTIIPSSSRSWTGRVIGYILDMLEVKDEHVLFSIPSDIEASNYSERLNQPGDFATLRQKHMDGMYKTLEQFENDVYMVYRKAVNSNSPNSMPYREAQSLLDQATKIFQSLRRNPTYVELELSTWHQDYFDYRRSRVEKRSVGCPHNTVPPASSSIQENPDNTKHINGALDFANVGRAGPRIGPQSGASSGYQGRKGKAPVVDGH